MIEKIKNLFRHKHVWIPDVVYINTETNFGMFNYHCKGCDHAFRARQHRLIRDGKIIEMPYHTWDIPEQDAMINVKELTDDEVAMLTYAIEPFHDETRGSGWKSKSEKTAAVLRRKLTKEYKRRKLFWDSYMHDE